MKDHIFVRIFPGEVSGRVAITGLFTTCHAPDQSSWLTPGRLQVGGGGGGGGGGRGRGAGEQIMTVYFSLFVFLFVDLHLSPSHCRP